MSLITQSVTKTLFSTCMGLLLSGGAAVKWNEGNGEIKMLNAHVVRTAFPRKESPLKYDPANIQLAYEYIFLETIYSPLVEYDSSGTIKPSVAKEFWWQDGKLNFEIRDDITTADGHIISAEDVVFSLKRVMLLGRNTHGNIVHLLCGPKVLKSISDDCPGLSFKNNIVTLSPSEPTPFLVPMLTGIDFAIIPKIAVQPDTLKIIDMRNTSGPMYLEKTSADGEITLRRNPKHFNSIDGQPNSIVLVPTQDSISAFENEKVDLITTIDAKSAEEVLSYHLAHEDTTSLHTSLDIRIFLMRFSLVGIKNFSENVRFSIGTKIVTAIRDAFKDRKTLTPTNQILPAYGEGSLNPEILAHIKNKSEDSANNVFDHLVPIKVYLIRLPDGAIFKAAIQRIFPNAIFIDSNTTALPNWGDDDADIVISGPDMGFVEDISLYTYALKSGALRAMTSPDAWLSNYMKIGDKESRIQQIQALHAYNLEHALAFPIFTSPYVALARKPWTITLPNLFANHPLWQIQRQP